MLIFFRRDVLDEILDLIQSVSEGFPTYFWKKKRYKTEEAKEYREVNKRIQKAAKKAKEDWIGAQCEETETCLNKKHQQEIISAGEGSTLRKKVLCSTGLGNILLKNKNSSAEGQNIAQNCTTISFVVTTQYWTAVINRKKIGNRSSVRKLRFSSITENGRVGSKPLRS